MERVNRRQRRAFSLIGGPVEMAGDPDASAVLAALFEVDPALARDLTHGFHSYAGRMHPSIARGAIRRWAAPGGRILDPFCGSGTVLVEAMADGRAAVGIDASPLAVGIAKTRTRCLGERGRAGLIEAADRIAESASERARKRRRPEIPRWARGETGRFAPHVALELLGLRELVMATPEDEVGHALRMCFSSILVKFMADQAQRIARGLPSRFFAGRVRELADGLAALERRTPPGTPRSEIHLGDACAYPDLRAQSVHLVLSSPPYAGTYDYAQHHDVRFTWLGLPSDSLARRQIGTRARGLGAAPRAWRDGRRRWLAEIGRALVPGAHAVLVVGDGLVGEQPEDAAAALAAEAPAADLLPVARASQTRPLRDRRLHEIFGATPRREHIVLLRKGP